ncbi:MAG TPA: amino acid--tRNA ligase-related protein [Steroidobacteraceae bacterium]|jgi:lysyl-tRNA synthetase class 2
MTDAKDSAAAESEVAARRAKLTALRTAGNPYPNDFRRDALAGQLQAAFGDRDKAWLDANPARVHVGGRILSRDMSGQRASIRIADRSGQITLQLQSKLLGAVFSASKEWDVGDIIGAGGVLFRGNDGELAVRVDSLRMLVKSLRPGSSVWPSVGPGATDSGDERMRTRTRARVVRYLRDFLDSLEFLEMDVGTLQPHPGSPSAPVVVKAFDRVYEISRNSAAPAGSDGPWAGNTLKVYLAYADYRDLMEWIEKAVRGLADTVHGREHLEFQGRQYSLGKPFRRLTVEQAIIANNPGIDPLSLRDITYLRTVCERLSLMPSADVGAGRLQMAIFDSTASHTLLDPTFVQAYPSEYSPAARPNDADPFLTDRFGFFLAGRELARGFSVLNDPERVSSADLEFVRALEQGMPPSAGLEVRVDQAASFFADSRGEERSAGA